MYDKIITCVLGGIEIICQNLVHNNQRVINVSPSLVSTIMHYLGNTKPNSSSAKKIIESEIAEGLTNFAPLGKLFSIDSNAHKVPG